VQHEIQLPVRARSGPAKGDLEWRRPTRETLQNMLRNPAYAGYYAYGRRQTDPRRKLPGRPDSGRVVRAEDEWLVLLPGRLPAYITEEEYRANLARLSANRQTAESPGAPRDGEALLSGLLRCGLCGGHRMSVRYHTRRRADGRAAHGYACAFYPVNYGTGDPCQHIAGPALDAYVAARVLDAVAPAALEVSMAARRAGRGRARRAGQAVAAAGRARPLRRGPGPPPVPARRPGEPARHPAARSRLGGRPRRGRAAGGRVPAVHRAGPRRPDHGRAGRDPGPGRRPAGGVVRADDHPRRPQGTAAHPHRRRDRGRRGRQRDRQRGHHLGRRAPDQRARRPPRRPAGPAVVLPPPSAPASPRSPGRDATAGRSPGR